MFVTTAFVSNVVVRDDETGFGPILRATRRIRKFDYLFGRFTGALLAAALSFLVVPAGHLDRLADAVGRPRDAGAQPAGTPTCSPMAWLALPSLLLTSAMFFALATVTRSMMWTYVGRGRLPGDLGGGQHRPEQARVRARRGLVGAAGRFGLRPGQQVLDRQRAQHRRSGPGRGAAVQSRLRPGAVGRLPGVWPTSASACRPAELSGKTRQRPVVARNWPRPPPRRRRR